MNFYTQRHQYTCGIDLHARTMYLCILDRDGQIVFDHNLPSEPAALLKAIEPFREDLVISAECMFAWYWLADVCLEQDITFVMGHALYMKAIHGGKKKNDKLDAYKIARLTYGLNLPTAYVYPPAMRATRDLMRRRCYFVRQRASLLAHIQITCQQYNLPPFNKRLSYKVNRAGVLDHFDTLDLSVQDMVQADLNIIDHLEEQIKHLESRITHRAKQHNAGNYYRLHSVIGVGRVLALTMLYEIHQIDRFNRVQDFLSYARLIRPSKTSAGKKTSGSSGRKIGNAHLKWAFCEATVLMLRRSEAAKRFVERKTRKYGKAKALGILAAKLGRAVYHMLSQQTRFDEKRFFAQM